MREWKRDVPHMRYKVPTPRTEWCHRKFADEACTPNMEYSVCELCCFVVFAFLLAQAENEFLCSRHTDIDSGLNLYVVGFVLKCGGSRT
jgi:hypothetical protein